MFAPIFRVGAADFDVRDEAEFKKVVASDAKLEKLATGMRFTEGPVWLTKDGGYLVFSDIPANELKKWTATGGLTTFRAPSHNANGNTIDREGRLISCEHSGRRLSVLVSIHEYRKGERFHRVYDELQTLVDSYHGKKFNAPNDAVVKSDGTVWFTDPTYGLPRGETKEQEGNFVFRFNPETKTTTVVVRDFDMPNGLCFSPDEKKLYVADSGKPRHIRAFDMQPGGTLTGSAVFCQIDKGGPDGIRCDADGRVWSSAGDGVHVFGPDGKLIGKILVPESPANLCFGGNDGKTLFITARTSLYSIPVLSRGDSEAQPPHCPRRGGSSCAARTPPAQSGRNKACGGCEESRCCTQRWFSQRKNHHHVAVRKSVGSVKLPSADGGTRKRVESAAKLFFAFRTPFINTGLQPGARTARSAETVSTVSQSCAHGSKAVETAAQQHAAKAGC